MLHNEALCLAFDCFVNNVGLGDKRSSVSELGECGEMPSRARTNSVFVKCSIVTCNKYTRTDVG